MYKEDAVEKSKEFESKYAKIVTVLSGFQDLEKFRHLFPYRRNPLMIKNLTKDRLYNPKKGARDYFFYWLVHSKIKDLGRIFLRGEKRLRNARDNVGKFKKLLKTALDDKLSLSAKIDDVDWDSIKGFRGERHIAKKIIASYYPERALPIFKEEDLERFAKELGINYHQEAKEKFGEDYGSLNPGERWELFNDTYHQFMDEAGFMEELEKKMRNVLFMRFLYDTYETT